MEESHFIKLLLGDSALMEDYIILCFTGEKDKSPVILIYFQRKEKKCADKIIDCLLKEQFNILGNTLGMSVSLNITLQWAAS